LAIDVLSATEYLGYRIYLEMTIMARMNVVPVSQEGQALIASGVRVEPNERERMIREAAYYQYVQRGFAHGYDIDDWLAAEAHVDQQILERQLPELGETIEFGVQQSATHGRWQDEALKRVIKQHPRRDIPRVEGMDPQDAPLKE
jgi:DUF2934 family protein